MRDPGLDRHEWETEWEALQPALEDSPAETLSEMGDLIERMMIEQKIPIHDVVADDGIEPEIVADYREARRITTLVERGADVPPGDIGAAVAAYRELYQRLITQLID